MTLMQGCMRGRVRALTFPFTTTTTTIPHHPRYKKGKIASEEVAAYKAYIQSLRDLAAEGAAPGFACTEVCEKEEGGSSKRRMIAAQSSSRNERVSAGRPALRLSLSCPVGWLKPLKTHLHMNRCIPSPTATASAAPSTSGAR